MADNDLARLEEWFGHILHGLSPAERRRAALKLGQALRRSNLKRITANVQPDGTAMEPKKERKDKHGKVILPAGSKMFRGLRFAKAWRIDAAQDGVELRPASNIGAYIGAVSQYGLTSTVGHLRGRGKIRAKYPERHLLGFSDEDRDLALQIAADLLEPKGF
ncbi:phage virion morphogenesis protein [Novosphingobium umbonatum]|nr:phage virion morphogenesis protein [Novosphingobium umbonatum]